MKNNSLKRVRTLIILLGAFIPMLMLPFFFEQIQVDSYISENNVFSDIYITYGNEEEYIKLSYSEATGNWYAFLPSHLKNCNIQFLHKNNALLLMDKNGIVNPQFALSEIENGEVIKLSVTYNHNTISSGNIILYQADSIPTMYVTTGSGSMEYIHNSKDNKEQANYIIYKSNGELNTTGECTIKGRGNSSWVGGMDGTGEKKPYNITLADDYSLLGMDNERKWTLLACYDDQAFIRNKITFELAQRLGCDYSPQAEFVNLYTNGEYKGLYLLTQRIAVDGGCVHIQDLDKLNSEINTAREYDIYDHVESGLEEHAVALNNNPDNITGGYLLEFDVRTYDVPGWFTTARNKIAIKSPEPTSVEQVNYIANYMREAESFIFDDEINSDSGKNYSDYIDIDSWARMYVLQDFLFNFDVNYSSFFVYKEADDNLLYAGPVWDFDLSMGNLHLGEYMDFTKQVLWIDGNDNRLWLNALMNKPEFSATVQEIYQNDFWNLLTKMAANDIPLWLEQLETSANMDALLWEKGNYDFTQKASAVLDWINDRKQFLTEYHTNPENYYKATFKLDEDRSFIYCVKKGEKLNYILDFEGYIWVDEMRNNVDTETVITEDTVFMPRIIE